MYYRPTVYNFIHMITYHLFKQIKIVTFMFQVHFLYIPTEYNIATHQFRIIQDRDIGYGQYCSA